MSAVAVQTPLVGFHPTFRQNQHSAAPPAALLTPAKTRQPGIITLSKPLNPRQSPKQRKATTTNGPTPVPATPKSEKSRKPRSRPSSDEEEHESPCKPRGRKEKEKEKEKTSPAGSKRPPRQTPSPTPQIQKPSGRLARQRKGTKSTSALSATIDTPPSAPMSVPKLSNAASQPSGLSRSAPMPTSMPARMRRTPTGNGREDPKEVPPSPSPRRVRESPKAPLTAPLASGFPSRPSHARFPSEVFNLSLDEPDDEHHEIPVLFRNRVYAGGRFQNGPDTTTLPAPSFLTGF